MNSTVKTIAIAAVATFVGQWLFAMYNQNQNKVS
jgi:hypothetical protein